MIPILEADDSTEGTGRRRRPQHPHSAGSVGDRVPLGDRVGASATHLRAGPPLRRVFSRLVRIALFTTLVLAGVASFTSARFAYRALSNRVHDLFALSLVASAVLVSLFAAAAVGRLLRLLRHPPNTFAARSTFCPSDSLIALPFILLSLLIIVGETPASFVSWEQLRGAPLAWIQNGHFYGPCTSLGRMCRTYWPVSFKPLAFAADALAISVAVSQARRLAVRWSRPA